MLPIHRWSGALLGTGWGRPDTFTLATALAARTTTFRPLAAIRPEVADALQKYAGLGITHFILSDTPYKSEAARIGDGLLPRMRDAATFPPPG